MTADSELGMIVVDGRGMTAYVFDKDTPGTDTSACTGDCLAAWPPILSATATPVVEGITGDVGTITTPDGEYQVTVNGMPIYTYAADMGSGDVHGQGVNDVWWVIDATGMKVETMPTSSGY